MAEVLTESFCERCGTRYTFESAQPRVKRLKGVKVLSRGLKNFVLSDDSSLDEAMAAARSDTDREVTSQQLDAFHKTFNFCMTCRQYTCANCWNEVEGACLTCSPHLGHEILPAPFPDLDPALGLTVAFGATDFANADDTASAAGTNGNGHAVLDGNAVAWPTHDLPAQAPDQPAPGDDLDVIDVEARMAALTAIGAGAPEPADDRIDGAADVEAPEEVATEAATEALQPVAAADIAEAPAVATTTDQVAIVAAAQTAALLHRFRPGQNLDAEIEAYEREQAALEAAAADQPAEPEPVVAAVEAAPEPAAAVEPAAAAEPEPAAAAEPEPVTAAEPEPLAAPEEPEAAAAVAAEVASPEDDHLAAAAAALAAAAVRPADVVVQPTWQIVAPDPESVVPLTPIATPPAPVMPNANASSPTPDWPAAPEWPTQGPAAGLPFLGRPAQPTGGLESLWAESNREVVSAPAPGRAVQTGVQPCVSCGLSLSATARFCRRCGTSQVA